MLMEILAKSGSSGYTIDSFLVAQRHLTRSFNLYGRSFNDVNREELDRYVCLSPFFTVISKQMILTSSNLPR